jgi:hypothetical protein
VRYSNIASPAKASSSSVSHGSVGAYEWRGWKESVHSSTACKSRRICDLEDEIGASDTRLVA